ncbi:MAG TPA: hypothetical protein VE891_03075 [Allosphingosinicella sp.]|nr:hypothetical protein [Allosphingosinicella sp.]
MRTCNRHPSVRVLPALRILYSSWGQELWYRYGSLAFLASGALVPALALSLGAQRKRAMPGALVAWMAMTLAAFACYAVWSGCGV